MAALDTAQYTLFASAARTSTVASSSQNVPEDNVVAFLDVTAASGTTPTLDVDIESLDPVSGKWFVVGSFAQKTTTGTERLSLGVVPDEVLRANATIGGTTPSFTFTTSLIAKDS